MPKLFAFVAIAACAAGLAACGGGNDKKVSAASLQRQVLPASAIPKAKLKRTFRWQDPIDVTVDGLSIPEGTPHSEVVAEMKRDGFEAAAGEELVQAKGNPYDGPQAFIGVIRFGSRGDARKFVSYIHKQDLKQPCFGVCSAQTTELKVPGVPGAEGVKHVPQKHPAPNAPPPFDAYAVEFPLGSNVYFLETQGGPGSVKPAQVTGGVMAAYKHARSTS